MTVSLCQLKRWSTRPASFCIPILDARLCVPKPSIEFWRWDAAIPIWSLTWIGGERGLRYDHVSRLICALTGAEDGR